MRCIKNFLFAKRVVREQRIPFEITTDIPNRVTREAMCEAETMRKYPERYKSYSSAKEMFEDILNEEA